MARPKTGDWVVCENGHPICRQMREIADGETNWHLAFGDWQQPEAAVGSFPVCEKCGGQFFASVGAMHYKEGWYYMGEFHVNPP